MAETSVVKVTEEELESYLNSAVTLAREAGEVWKLGIFYSSVKLALNSKVLNVVI